MMGRTAEESPSFKARIAGAFYLLNILTGALALFVKGRLSFAAILVAALCYIVVTLLFYGIFSPVNRSLSLLAVPLALSAPFISSPPRSTPWYFLDSIAS